MAIIITFTFGVIVGALTTGFFLGADQPEQEYWIKTTDGSWKRLEGPDDLQ
jgi:cytochrome bd-type quinol oxidase subunit 2